MSNTKNNYLWNSGTEYLPIKTDYDSCPKGWRVPTYNELITLKKYYYSNWTTNSDDQCGRYFGNNSLAKKIFLPAAGKRDEGDYAYGRGDWLYYWSSSTSGISAKFLGNWVLGWDYDYYDSRSCSFSVRCVQE